MLPLNFCWFIRWRSNKNHRKRNGKCVPLFKIDRFETARLLKHPLREGCLIGNGNVPQQRMEGTRYKSERCQSELVFRVLADDVWVPTSATFEMTRANQRLGAWGLYTFWCRIKLRLQNDREYTLFGWRTISYHLMGKLLTLPIRKI